MFWTGVDCIQQNATEPNVHKLMLRNYDYIYMYYLRVSQVAPVHPAVHEHA